MSVRSVIVGIGGLLGHDANAALFVDGRLIAAAQEERFTRRKHEGSFPRLAAADCLASAALGPADVTDVVFAEKPLQSRFNDLLERPGNTLTRALATLVPERMGSLYVQQARGLMRDANFHYAWHHLSHVAGAFHTSPFERAAFLCLDGKGEDSSASAGVIDHGQVHLQWEQPYGNGLGLFYTLLTYFLGFPTFGSEYKVMGLAPYGRPRYVAELSRLFTTDAHGGFQVVRDIRFDWPGPTRPPAPGRRSWPRGPG